MLKIDDIEMCLREVGKADPQLHVSRIRENIIITDLTGQSRIKHKALGAALKKRGLKLNHIRKDGAPAICIFPSNHSKK